MKNILAVSAVSLILFGSSQIWGCRHCKAAPQTKFQQSQPKTGQKEVTLKVSGMTCAGCANTLHSALSKTNGVLKDEVKFPGDVAIIKYDASKISEAQIIKVIEKAGYKAEIQKENKKQS